MSADYPPPLTSGSQVQHRASGCIYTVTHEARRYGIEGVYVVDLGTKRWIPLRSVIPLEAPDA